MDGKLADQRPDYVITRCSKFSRKSHFKTLGILIPTFKLYMGVFLLKEEEIMI